MPQAGRPVAASSPRHGGIWPPVRSPSHAWNCPLDFLERPWEHLTIEKLAVRIALTVVTAFVPA